MDDIYMEMVLMNEVVQMPSLLESCVRKYITENQFRIYIKPTDFSEYAKTFKIVKTKRKDERK